MSYVVLCPFVHRPSFEAMLSTLDPALAEQAIILDNTDRNLGAAGSRNVGARRLLDTGADWLVDISPVTRFGPQAGRDFVAALDEHPDAWVVQSHHPVNWHLMAWHRRLFETVGFFDENFWPIYGEDGDISRRIHLAFAEGAAGEWANVDADAWVTMYGHSQKLAGLVVDQVPLWDYYAEKWGGRWGAETFTRPFDGDDLAFWPTPPDPRSIIGDRQ